MSVEKVFWQDPYLQNLDAVISRIDGNDVILDKTIIYSFSGGQESDSASIGGNKVIDSRIEDHEIIYTVNREYDLFAGQKIKMHIDWPRRYRLMRLHFAAELVLELVYQKYNKPYKTGAHISPAKARLDFEWNGNINEAINIIKPDLEMLINENHDIHSFFTDEKNEIRCWEIDDFACVNCGGTHLRTTSEIGEVRLKRNNIGKGRERIEITLMDPDLSINDGDSRV